VNSVWPAAALAVLLSGCATAFPDDLRRTVNRAVTVTELRQNPTAYLGQRVMIGGEILVTRPMPADTEVELLSKPLESDDRPQRGDVSDGRVLVTTAQFLDPAVYAEGRRITVIGTVTGEEERKVGELSYRYPVVSVISIHLWPRDVVVPPYPPAWPYYPWPYYYPWRYRLYGPWPYSWW